MSTGSANSVFVGREQDLATLTDAFTRTGDGVPATVLVNGEAGVGKSTLIARFATELPEPTTVLTGGCLDLGDTGLAFAPFTAVLRGLVRDLGVAGVIELLPRGDVGELCRLLPALGIPEDLGDSPELARARLFEQFLALLEAIAEDRRVVLVIEDFHWADQSSRDLLSFIISNQQATPKLLTIVTYRSEHLDRDHPGRRVLAELARVAWVRRLDLGRLTQAGVTAQLLGLLGQEPESSLRDEIFSRSEGNPLFVEALLPYAGRPTSRLPKSVRDLLVSPLERFPADTQDVIRAAATGGVRVGHDLLAAVTGLDDTALSDALRPAVASNLMVVDDDAYVFRHALIREVVHEDLLPGERGQLHVRYAEVFEQHPRLAPPGRVAVELAHHWYAGARQHPAKALTSAWQAAREARKSLAHAEERRMLTRVLELWDRVPEAATEVGADHVTVLQKAIEAAMLAGEGAEATALIDEALAEIDPAEPARLGQVLRHRGELCHALGRPGGLDDLREAARLVPAEHPARTSVLATLVNRLLTVPREEEGRAAAQEAIRAARQAGDVRSEAVATVDLAYSHARTGDIDGQLPRIEQARETAERRGDHIAVQHALRREADLLQGAGRYERAVDSAQRGLATCTQAGLTRTSGPIHAANLAEALLCLGRWEEAGEIIEHVLEFPPIPSSHAYLHILRGTIGLARGDLARAQAASDYARTVFSDGHADTQDLLPLARLEVDLRLAQDRREASVEIAARALASKGIEESPRWLWPLLAAGARVAGTDTAAGGALLADLRAVAARLPVIGPAQQALQLLFTAELTRSLGRSDRAAWDHAAAAFGELSEPYPQAQALVSAAEAAADAGEHEQIAERLRGATERVSLLGAHPLRTRIDRLAKAARIRLPESGDVAGSEDELGERNRRRLGLTEREIEVLQLVADGRTNRQIGEELFIAVKTVNAHVSNILGKLEVSGRVQAATVAHRMHLLD
ncbi:ATP-binding protein [Amycolatopsis sp. lyj-112]|uniref:ATP-binding protein n=1 Tax=Amycolatopsis sp. lyj-112 TaxID=2789288 RepID=UPI00397D9F10